MLNKKLSKNSKQADVILEHSMSVGKTDPSNYIKWPVCLCVTFFQSHYRYQLLMEGDGRCRGQGSLSSIPL